MFRKQNICGARVHGQDKRYLSRVVSMGICNTINEEEKEARLDFPRARNQIDGIRTTSDTTECRSCVSADRSDLSRLLYCTGLHST